jgi:hypothetical protein
MSMCALITSGTSVLIELLATIITFFHVDLARRALIKARRIFVGMRMGKSDM